MTRMTSVPMLIVSYFVLNGTFGNGKSTRLDVLQMRGIRESLNRLDSCWQSNDPSKWGQSPKGIPIIRRAYALEC